MLSEAGPGGRPAGAGLLCYAMLVLAGVWREQELEQQQTSSGKVACDGDGDEDGDCDRDHDDENDRDGPAILRASPQ